jgi:hypothetical protein
MIENENEIYINDTTIKEEIVKASKNNPKIQTKNNIIELNLQQLRVQSKLWKTHNKNAQG